MAICIKTLVYPGSEKSLFEFYSLKLQPVEEHPRALALLKQRDTGPDLQRGSAVHSRTLNSDYPMLRWIITFLIVALIAGIFGFTGVAGAATDIARILFYIFLVLLLIAVVAGLFRGSPPAP